MMLMSVSIDLQIGSIISVRTLSIMPGRSTLLLLVPRMPRILQQISWAPGRILRNNSAYLYPLLQRERGYYKDGTLLAQDVS